MSWLWRNGTPARVLDVLATDGGWLTIHHVADCLDVQHETVRRSLYRMRDRDMVASRLVEHAVGRRLGGVSVRISEWRAV